MTGLLASVATLEEAEQAVAWDADIVDLKDPAKGALGAWSEAGLREAVERLAVDSPVHAAVVVALVVERKSGLLERGKIAADGTRRDLELRREGVNRGTVP